MSLAVMYTYLYDICFPLPIYPLSPSSNSLCSYYVITNAFSEAPSKQIKRKIPNNSPIYITPQTPGLLLANAYREA